MWKFTRFFKKRKELEITAAKIYTKSTDGILGRRFPIFVRTSNQGDKYSLINSTFYEDEIIDAWEKVTLKDALKKIEEGRLAFQISSTSIISIHNLAVIKISSAQWTFEEMTAYNYLNSLKQEIINKQGNQLTGSGLNESLNNSRSKSLYISIINENGKIVEGKGKEMFVFSRSERNKFRIINLIIFQNGKIYSDEGNFFKEMEFKHLQTLISCGKICSELPGKGVLYIQNLGICEVEKSIISVPIKEKLYELQDIIKSLNSEPTTIQKCYRDYKNYLKQPSLKTRDELRMSYEKIPKHLRIYVLGDMERKDLPIRKIIYNE